MKKLIFGLMFALGITLTGCSFFDSSEVADEQVQNEPPEITPVRYWSKSYRTVVTYLSTGPCAWHRVHFRIDGRDSDSFENNVDCWHNLHIGDSIYVEEHWGGYHYYKISKIVH